MANQSLPPSKWATGKDQNDIVLIKGKCLNRLETKYYTFMDWVEAYPGPIDYNNLENIWLDRRWTKQHLINLCYGQNHTGIDSAIPRDLWDRYDPALHVVEYGPHDASGRLVNLLEKACEVGVVIADPLLDARRIQWALDRDKEQIHINREIS